MPMPQPDNSADKWSAFYQNVSCASATFCLATANADTGQVWRWDGHAWHLAKLKVSVPHFGTVFFSGVSCAAARECVVVGHRSIRISGSPAYGEAPFRAVLDGNTWSVANLSVPTGTVDEQADTVSCWSVKHCRILGSTTQLDDVTAWEWSGNSFNATAGYADSKVPKLHSMSCTSATFCVAAGWDNPVNSVPSHSAHLDLLWNGIAWTSLAVHRTPLGGTAPHIRPRTALCVAQRMRAGSSETTRTSPRIRPSSTASRPADQLGRRYRFGLGGAMPPPGPDTGASLSSGTKARASKLDDRAERTRRAHGVAPRVLARRAGYRCARQYRFVHSD